MSTTTAPMPQTELRDDTDLGGYAAPQDGHARELVSVPGAAGSTLVIDRLASTHADARLVAQLRRCSAPTVSATGSVRFRPMGPFASCVGHARIPVARMTSRC
jgi:hypothetical protein